MFDEYLIDAYAFLSSANTEEHNPLLARRLYRAAVFAACSAMEAFIRHVAEVFPETGKFSEHEVNFINDIAYTYDNNRFEVKQGFRWNRLEDKLKLVIRRFEATYDFGSSEWSNYMNLKNLRDSLIHSNTDDDRTISEYKAIISVGLRSIVCILNRIAISVFGKALRRSLLDIAID